VALRSEEAGENPARSRHCKSGQNLIRTLNGQAIRKSDLPSYGKVSNWTQDPKGDQKMSETVLNPASEPAVIPVRELVPWLVFAVVLLLAIYFVGVEEGAVSIFPGMYVHEFVHDGRHLLGFPCH
jgi:Probable cobalt transporter subunit (CbtB)